MHKRNHRTVPLHADATLRNLALRFDNLEARREALLDLHDLDAMPPAVNDELTRIEVELRELNAAIGDIPAISPDGWLLKARAMLLWLDSEVGVEAGGEPDREDDSYLAWSLCRDLLRAAEHSTEMSRKFF